MPKRRRPKAPKAEPIDPVVQFGALLRESAEREQANRERALLERQQALDAALAAEAHAAALESARRDLATAIDRARDARRAGAGVVAADLAWREAKARLIELETGERPAWASGPEAAAPDVSPDA